MELWNFVRSELDKFAKDPNHLAQESPTGREGHVLQLVPMPKHALYRYCGSWIRISLYADPDPRSKKLACKKEKKNLIYSKADMKNIKILFGFSDLKSIKVEKKINKFKFLLNLSSQHFFIHFWRF